MVFEKYILDLPLDIISRISSFLDFNSCVNFFEVSKSMILFMRKYDSYIYSQIFQRIKWTNMIASVLASKVSERATSLSINWKQELYHFLAIERGLPYIIEWGSSKIKAGLACRASPLFIDTETLVSALEIEESDNFVKNLVSNQDFVYSTSFAERWIVSILTELGVQSVAGISLILVVSHTVGKHRISLLLSHLLDKGFGRISVEWGATASLYCTDEQPIGEIPRPCGIYVDVGHVSTTVVLVRHGYVYSDDQIGENIPDREKFPVYGNYGGLTVTKQLQKLVKKRFPEVQDFPLGSFEKLKVQQCYVRLASPVSRIPLAVEISLASRTVFDHGLPIEIDTERFMCAEILLNPSIDPEIVDGVGIHKLIANCIGPVATRSQEAFLGNIVLCGATAGLPGFDRRLRKALCEEIGCANSIKLKVLSPFQRTFACWRGTARKALYDLKKLKWATIPDAEHAFKELF